jgi:hypothetical protein
VNLVAYLLDSLDTLMHPIEIEERMRTKLVKDACYCGTPFCARSMAALAAMALEHFKYAHE